MGDRPLWGNYPPGHGRSLVADQREWFARMMAGTGERPRGVTGATRREDLPPEPLPPQKVGHEWRVAPGPSRFAEARCPWCGSWVAEDTMVKAQRQQGWRAIEVDRRPKSPLGARIGRWDPALVRIPNVESALVCVDCSLPGHEHPQVGLARAGKPRLVRK